MHRLTGFSLRHPMSMWVLLALITVVLATGLTRLRTEFGFRDIGRAMIAAILIGIGVDDAAHILTHHRNALAARKTPTSAIHEATLRAGRAVVTTSAVLALGFLTLTASAWKTISSFGLFIALALLGALASTMLVLPALIYAADTRRGTA